MGATLITRLITWLSSEKLSATLNLIHFGRLYPCQTLTFSNSFFQDKPTFEAVREAVVGLEGL
jgi:hypothetical protein